jgi:hypothetical protein
MSDELAELSRLGHRGFIGGLWDELGRLQVDFPVSEGLEPAHVLLDIGCGSLRGGVHLIPYLEPGRSTDPSVPGRCDARDREG